MKPLSKETKSLQRFTLACTSIVCFALLSQLFALTTCAQSTPAAYTFTTFAGYAGTGNTDGIGTAALFSNPIGVAVDGAGNVFVADSGNRTIRKITPAGVVNTIAGLPGVAGIANGTNNTARFGYPIGLALDGTGNLYVVDTAYPMIRKVTPVGANWVVTTVAGTGSQGSTDGTNDAVRFYLPGQIAFDAAGNLYVADSGNHTIRMITPVGGNWVSTTIAGLAGVSGSADGAGDAARFYYPYGIAVDSSTNVYVAENSNPLIRKLTPTGTNWIVSTIAGQAGSSGTADGTNNTARFSDLQGLTVDSAGVLYAASGSWGTIRRIAPMGTNWVVTTFAGVMSTNFIPVIGSADGTGTNALFRRPAGITIDNIGNLFVADSGNSAIRKITSAGVVTTIAGSASANSVNGTGSAARFNNPIGLALDSSGNVYVADEGNHTIRKITTAGVVSTIAGAAGAAGSTDGAGNNARFNGPRGVAVDGAGNVYVADTRNRAIRKITPAGLVTTLISSSANPFGCLDGTNNAVRFSSPVGIALNNSTNLYVLDQGCTSVRQMALVGTNWVVTTIAGQSGLTGSADGEGTNAAFNAPQGITIDGAGNIYVADYLNRTIRRITPDGTNWIVSTIAGLAGSAGEIDGTNNASRFDFPTSVAVDSAGNVYATDSAAEIIRKIQPAGTNWVTTTIAGEPRQFGSADGPGNVARFYHAWGIAVDSAGSVYVADTLNNTIRKGVFSGYAAAVSAPYVSAPMNGRLKVTLLPPEANGQWRFPWEFSWHNSGATVSNLVEGNYSIEFRNVPGYLAISTQPLQVTNGGTTSITNEYFPTIDADDTNSMSGSLTVFLGSTPPPGAGWRFAGENAAFSSIAFATNLLPGTYLIEFAAVSGRVKPASQLVQVNSGQPSYLSANYLLAASPPSGIALPSMVPANQVNDETTMPFGFNGQLQSDIGYGSGVAIETNVVLTAAHLVFNDHTLSYVNRAHWFFRRSAGVSEPLPQTARGFYLLSGYAAQRTNDLGSGHSPDQSTPPSRNFDVAALYFLSPVAGGGHGGYLPSDAVPNTWLASTALKMLVGYPVDGSQFGDASIVAGKMYQTTPRSDPLTLSSDPVPAQQQVYVAPWFLSYPGNSGGALYVQFNGYYYPAAVYLGTLFSGAQPYASVVRAIDSNVVSLITLAATQGDSGTNNTGGGVITIIPSQNISSNNPGYLQMQLAPPSAVAAGAGWRLANDTTFGGDSKYTRQINSTNTFGVEFKTIPGWNLPANQSITVRPNPNVPTVVTGYYTVNAPLLAQLRVSSTDRLGMTGTTGTMYRLERKSALTNAAWQPVATNTIRTNGFNPVLTNPAPGFYRLNWLTNF